MMGAMQQTEATPQSQFIQGQPAAQPAAEAPAAAPTAEDTATRLSKLQTLLDQNIITQEDFDAQRARILDSI